MTTVYTTEDKEWFREEIKKLKKNNAFNAPGVRNSGFLDRFFDRFKRSIKIEVIMATLKRIDDPETVKRYYLNKKENARLRKQGLLPSKTKITNSQNTGDLLSKYPFIIVIGDKVAGYETEEQIIDAIKESQVPTNMIKMFEVKERKIKAELSVEIE